MTLKSDNLTYKSRNSQFKLAENSKIYKDKSLPLKPVKSNLTKQHSNSKSNMINVIFYSPNGNK